MARDVSQQLAPFITVSAGPRHTVVRREWADPISAALLRGEGCEVVPGDGRGTMQRFRLDESHTALIRTYRRGGLIAPLLKDRFFLVNRPLRELRLLATLHAQGLPVPEPLGALWKRSTAFYHGAIATEELDAPHLQQILRERPAQSAAVLPRVGELIRRFHDAGLFHADLQIRNILVAASGIFLIDFDRARLYAALTPRQCWRNLLRLRRSLQKNRFPDEYFQHICTGYGADHLPRWLDGAYRFKGRVSDRLQGRDVPR